MKRLISQQLAHWKEDPHRKPLLLRGARQVGKTTVVRQLGEQFDSFVEVNFEASENLRRVFAEDFDIPRIISDLQIITGKD